MTMVGSGAGEFAAANEEPARFATLRARSEFGEEALFFSLRINSAKGLHR